MKPESKLLIDGREGICFEVNIMREKLFKHVKQKEQEDFLVYEITKNEKIRN